MLYDDDNTAFSYLMITCYEYDNTVSYLMITCYEYDDTFSYLTDYLL